MTPTTLRSVPTITRAGGALASDRIVARPAASTAVAVVLAGSYLAADRSFSGSLPRPLLPVAQIPIIGYVLRWLRDAGIGRAVICSNHGSRAIRTCLGDAAGLSMDLDYTEDATPRGPAGCARDAALNYGAETFIVADATVIPDFDLASLLDAHRESGAAVTAVVHYASRGAAGASRVATPAGIYAFSRRAFDIVSERGFQDIKEHLLPALRNRRERIAAFTSPQFCPRVLDAETYLAVNHWVIERLPLNPSLVERWGPFSVSGEVAMHATASVHRAARIVGPAVLGANVVVGADALIVGPTSLGPGTRVGEQALVCRSVLWEGCQVGASSFVDASIVGDGIVVDPGTMLHGEVRMNRQRASAPRWRLVPAMPRLQPAPATSMADLAIP